MHDRLKLKKQSCEHVAQEQAVFVVGLDLFDSVYWPINSLFWSNHYLYT